MIALTWVGFGALGAWTALIIDRRGRPSTASGVWLIVSCLAFAAYSFAGHDSVHGFILAALGVVVVVGEVWAARRADQYIEQAKTGANPPSDPTRG